MVASGGGEDSTRAGYYADPSIPGYIRYWNGSAWVPGTSRPAPSEGEAMPAPPPGLAQTQLTAPVPDETGPMFLDEEPPLLGPASSALPELRPRGEMDVREVPDVPVVRPEPTPPVPVDWDDPRRLHGSRPEPASAWQADASRQAGFGGERDRRVSWGSDADDPRGPSVPDPRRAAPASDAGGQALPPGRQSPALPPAGPLPAPGGAGRVEPDPDAGGGPQAAAGSGRGRAAATPTAPGVPGADGTLSIRAVPPGQARHGAPRGSGDEGTMSIRAVDREAARNGPVAGAPPTVTPAGHPRPQVSPQQPAGPRPPVAGQPQGPAAQPPGGQVPAQRQVPGWPPQAQPVPRRPGPAGPPAGPTPERVVPWKPPVDNPFQQLAQAQGRPAPLARRFLARLLDTVLLLAVVGAAAFPLWGRATDHIDEKVQQAKQSGETVTVYLLDGTTGLYAGLVLGLLLLLGVLFEALPTAVWGRTLGKKLCGLRTLDIEGHDKPSFGAALRRWLVYGVLGLLLIGIVNVLWCLFDRPWRQCWHDKAARTFVAVGG